jgi:hypothetical protein
MKAFALIFLITNSCSVIKTSPYLKSLQLFKGDLVEHFPRNQKGLMGFYSLVPNAESMINGKGNYIAATFEYDKISQFIFPISDSLPKYFPNDSCQLVVSRVQEMIVKRNCVCKTIPIPDFIVEIDRYQLLGDNFNVDGAEIQQIKLPKDFEYFVDAKSGIYIEREDLFENLKIPDCWEHGYSRGFAISKKRNLVIIWLEIW